MLSARMTDAFEYARLLHDGQLRKGTQTPYISHLMSVSSLVLDSGGSEDEAISALLHDAVEDCGGLPVLEKIRQKFGDEIADIVKGCSEPEIQPRPPWKDRKKAYISQIASESDSVKRVACADKLHNLRSILTDYHSVGDRVWDRFHADKEGTLWFYQSMLETLRTFGDGMAIFVELEKRVTDLGKIVNGSE